MRKLLEMTRHRRTDGAALGVALQCAAIAVLTSVATTEAACETIVRAGGLGELLDAVQGVLNPKP
jgi:hypothetical protein